MGRRKPVSGKLKKAQLQHSRAVKHAKETGEAVPSAPKAVRSHARKSNPNSQLIAKRYLSPEEQARLARKDASLKIESRFLKLPGELVAYFREVLSSRELDRPVQPSLAFCDVAGSDSDEGLTCPKRPKWSYNSTKDQVEKNEEGLFKKWLSLTDETLKRHNKEKQSSPSFFERNLNVWRQLWRVTEQSDLLLVLADVRFVPLHLPPSLLSYLDTLKPKKPIVVVLTKTDLVPSDVSLSWQAHLERTLPAGSAVVLMESYRRAESSQANQVRFVPEAPEHARAMLVEALKAAHARLLEPPPVVASDPEKLARWQPRVRRTVDWETVVPAQTKLSESQPLVEQMDDETISSADSRPFVVGLIGQPNVGKSSLLNAFLQRKVVRASKTPGKTKTFQTIFVNSTLKLVDCPGLVFPSWVVGFEQQVLGGVIPIQHVEAVMYYVAQRMPIEKTLSLEQAADEFALEPKAAKWTVDSLLASYADQQGFVTAKAGRPDLHRAGSLILRQLHSGRIPWAFLPPNAPVDHEGILLTNFEPSASHDDLDEHPESERDASSSESESSSTTDSDTSVETSSETEDPLQVTSSVGGAFAALSVEDDEQGDPSSADELERD